MALPITEFLDKIATTVQSNPVTQVNAPTGSGKSIHLINELANRGMSIISSVPTRLSATSLCSYLSSLNKNITVGHAAEGKTNYDYKTQVVYATSGHVRRKLVASFNTRRCIKFCDVLVLDETHSGSMDNTVILSLWVCARLLGLPHPKLLLLSATPSDLPVEPAPVVIDVPIPTRYPVSVQYVNPDLEDMFSGEEKTIYKFAAELALEKHERMSDDGDMLIFVPGAAEVEDIVGYLSDVEGLYAIPAYSNLESEELQKIYDPTPNGERKVIVATNIAESSITIDNVSIVIDTLLARDMVPTPSGTCRLETSPITKDSAKQRAGRTGRTRPGICYRLMSESEYEELDHHRIPEVERLPLHNVVMELLSINVEPTEYLRGADVENIQASKDLLLSLGLIHREDDSHYIVTDSGKFAPTVPLGVKTAAFLWRWMQDGNPLYPGVVVACLIDAHSQGYFHYPRRPPKTLPHEYAGICESHTLRYYKKWIGETHLHTYLNMWCDLISQMGRYHYSMISNPMVYKYKKWFFENKINIKQMADMMMLLSQTYSSCVSHLNQRSRDSSRSRGRGHSRIQSVREVGRGIRSSTNSTRISPTLLKVDLNVAAFDPKDCAELAISILQETHCSDTVSSDYAHDQFKRLSSMTGPYFSRVIALAKHEILTNIGRIVKIIDMSIPTKTATDSPLSNSSDSWDS